MKYDSILFDLDGTLWDSTEPIAVSWKEALKYEPDIDHAPTVAELRGVMGMTSEKLMATLFPQLSPQRGAQLFERCCEVEIDYLKKHGGKLYDGLRETLSLLSRKLPLFIVSNCNDGYIESFLEAHDMYPFFKDWECIGRTGKQKWENIRLVMERNGLHSPVYVGDTAMDRDSAEKAGVPFLFAAYGFGTVENAPSIHRIPELSGLLEAE